MKRTVPSPEVLPERFDGRAQRARVVADALRARKEQALRDELEQEAKGKIAKLPIALVVEHVRRITRGGDSALALAALEAIVRRFEILGRDELRVTSRPRTGLGRYRTGRRRQTERAYDTWLLSFDPIVGSCDCRDYLRSSLGVCKHILAAMIDLSKKPRRLAQAKRDAISGMRDGWSWDPIRPLIGRGGALDRIRFVALDQKRTLPPSLADLFQQDAPGYFVPRVDFEDAAERLGFVAALLGVAKRSRDGFEPALRALLEDESARASRLVTLEANYAKARSHLKTVRRKLFPYQVAGVERMLFRGRQLLGDDMGLGKTTQATATCHALFRSGLVKRGMIVTPASLKSQWASEWRTLTDVPVTTVEGSPAERAEIYRSVRSAGGFVIVNYEQTLRDLDLMLDFASDIVVLDEAQRIKNWQAITTACVRKLTPEYRIVLTGTPMENRIDELATVVEWIDDRALEPRWRLAPWHTATATGPHDVVGARNLDTLRIRLEPCMLRRRRSEVLLQLPSRTDHVVSVDLCEEQELAHRELDQPIARLIQKARERALLPAEHVQLMQLLTQQRMISNGMAQVEFAEISERLPNAQRDGIPDLSILRSPKLVEFREVVRELIVEQGRKIVVFSQWRKFLELARWSIGDVLERAGLRALFFTGAQNVVRRAQNVKEFHEDPNCRILFATDAGGVGLNLQRAANACLNLELPWNPAVLEQRIGRIHRLGQPSPIDVFNFVSNAGIEQRIQTLVGTKRALFTALFDGKSDEVAFERGGKFLERLGALIEPMSAGRDSGEAESDPDQATSRAVSTQAACESEDTETTLEEPNPSSPTTQRTAVPAFAGSPAIPSPESIGHLLSSIRVRPTEGGGVSIDAPSESVASLSAILEGVLKLLKH